MLPLRFRSKAGQPLLSLLSKFPAGDEVVLVCGTWATHGLLYLHQHIGNRLYFRTTIEAGDTSIGANYWQTVYFNLCEYFKGFSKTTTPALTSTFTWSDNAAFLGGGYYYSTADGEYLQVQTENLTTSVGCNVYAALPNAGMCLVTIDSDPTLADLLPTAQALVTGGSLAAAALIANGGTLNPTDRILDCYNLTADALYPANGKVVMFSRSLTPGVHTVRITSTPYQNVAATPGLFTGIYMILTGGPNVASATSVNSTALHVFVEKKPILPCSGVWEISYKAKPTGASDYEWIGHTGSLKIKSDPVIKVDGSTVTPTLFSQHAGTSIAVITQNNVRHTETGNTNLGVLDLTYTIDRNGLSIAHTLTWASNGVSVRYPCMFCVADDPFDRFNTLGSGIVGTNLTANDDQPYFNTREQVAYCWDSDGYIAGAMYIPDLAKTVENWTKTTTLQLFWDDLGGGVWEKVYAVRFMADEAYTTGTIWQSEAIYKIAWITSGANAKFASLK
jgi:hypothetical protein